MILNPSLSNIKHKNPMSQNHSNQILDTSDKIYKTPTHRKFRNVPLPDGERKRLVLENIIDKVSKNMPIKFLQFWGGSKNINLPIQEVDLCEIFGRSC